MVAKVLAYFRRTTAMIPGIAGSSTKLANSSSSRPPPPSASYFFTSCLGLSPDNAGMPKIPETSCKSPACTSPELSESKRVKVLYTMTSAFNPAAGLAWAMTWSNIFCALSMVAPNSSKCAWIFPPKVVSHSCILSKAGRISSRNLLISGVILSIKWCTTVRIASITWALMSSTPVMLLATLLICSNALSVVEPLMVSTTSVLFWICSTTSMLDVRYVAVVAIAGSRSSSREPASCMPTFDQPCVDCPTLPSIREVVRLP
mmetsp:Transcript_85661/g.262104  ORF Transcript_85661/g.262104 Transcript_85661/m.262104 type:complete len:260 (-) Transcript_85661:69-848(-)